MTDELLDMAARMVAFGVCAIAAGVFILCGWAWALITLGVSSTAFGLIFIWQHPAA